nr:hypothetical protein [Treponemataceae bacterium]
ELIGNLSYKDKKKINNLIIGDIICFLAFFTFSIALGVLKLPIVSLLMGITTAAFLISLIMIKTGHISIGSYLATAGFIIGTVVIAFFAGPCDLAFVHYRTGCFCVVMAILNFMVAIHKPQLIIFHVSSYVALIGSFLTVYKGVFTTDLPLNNITSLVVNMLGILAGNMILYSSTKLNDKILIHSEKEHDQIEENLNTITDALSQAEQSMNIGQKLNDSTNKASQSVTQINSIYREVLTEADQLREQTQIVKNSSNEVDNQANIMSQAVKKQNASLTETSVAMNEISSNIQSINLIAAKRREGMEGVIDILNTQGDLLKQLVNDVERVKASSAEITKFVQTVDDIAGQTNLLAMNASIEAAHAGTMGKGFGVIAQEIRKLSEETSKNASKIADTLKENTTVVKETSESVEKFAKSTEGSTEEIRRTVDSMEEIIKGIEEITSATGGITNSIQNVVNLSQETEVIIGKVVSQISEQGTSLGNISNSTDILTEKVSSIKESLIQITGAIDEIHKNAKDNEVISGRIASLLN